MAKIKKQTVSLGLSYLAINGLIYFSLIPYIQTTANQHMSMSGFFTILFIAIAIVVILIAGKKIYKKEPSIIPYFLLGLGINLILWIPAFLKIGCEGCANGG